MTSMSASRWLFCVTISPGRGLILNLKTRGPASEAVNRTRTAAGSPSTGSFTSCEPTIFPPSSTSSVTDSPANPVCVTTTSIISEVPLSAARGADTRSTCTSFASDSRPTPTVNTGTDAAFMASSASVREASVVSAPSLTTTRPARGRPASSWRAPSSDAPIRVWAPANVRSDEAPTRDAVDENLKVRMTNRSESDFRSAASGVANVWRAKFARGAWFQSAICMLRESSIRTPRKFCCGTAALTTRTGRKRQKSTSSRMAVRIAASTTRCRIALFDLAARYVRNVTAIATPTTAAAT